MADSDYEVSVSVTESGLSLLPIALVHSDSAYIVRAMSIFGIAMGLAFLVWPKSPWLRSRLSRPAGSGLNATPTNRTISLSDRVSAPLRRPPWPPSVFGSDSPGGPGGRRSQRRPSRPNTGRTPTHYRLGSEKDGCSRR